jgi:hypothetical protein
VKDRHSHDYNWPSTDTADGAEPDRLSADVGGWWLGPRPGVDGLGDPEAPDRRRLALPTRTRLCSRSDKVNVRAIFRPWEVSVGGDERLADAAERMHNEQVGSVVVTVGGRFAGILTERGPHSLHRR